MHTYFYNWNSAIQSGFTLVEMLVVLAIASIIGSLTLTDGISYYDRSLAGIDRTQILAALREARSEAQDEATTATTSTANPYGVYISNTGYVVFEGSSYGTRIPSQDSTFTFITPEIVSDGSLEILFAPLTAEVNSATSSSSYTLISITGIDHRTQSIQIGSQGSIQSTVL